MCIPQGLLPHDATVSGALLANERCPCKVLFCGGFAFYHQLAQNCQNMTHEFVILRSMNCSCGALFVLFDEIKNNPEIIRHMVHGKHQPIIHISCRREVSYLKDFFGFIWFSAVRTHEKTQTIARRGHVYRRIIRQNNVTAGQIRLARSFTMGFNRPRLDL